jgi:hypothetical protein
MKKTTEQKECECHCHHHGNCVEDAACIAMYCEHCLPQPTDGLLNGWEDVALFSFPVFVHTTKGYGNKHGETYRGQPINVRQLLDEQRLKTREDTLNNIEAIWTWLMNETDDPVYKEIYASCIKALKI